MDATLTAADLEQLALGKTVTIKFLGLRLSFTLVDIRLDA